MDPPSPFLNGLSEQNRRVLTMTFQGALSRARERAFLKRDILEAMVVNLRGSNKERQARALKATKLRVGIYKGDKEWLHDASRDVVTR